MGVDLLVSHPPSLLWARRGGVDAVDLPSLDTYFEELRRSPIRHATVVERGEDTSYPIGYPLTTH